MIKIGAVAKKTMYQGIVESEDDADSTELERIGLDDHSNMVVLSRKCCIVNHLGRLAEVHLFSPEYEVLKFPIIDDVMQYDDPY